ncbi:hypothetical protein GOV12_07975 [Candidatus Pacearchaeota archaeon]|nr:hypothetical protein [Candidatus Pacearchaeota archaeon]
MKKINTKEIIEDIITLDLTVNQLSKKYKVNEQVIEDKLKYLEKQGFVDIDYVRNV